MTLHFVTGGRSGRRNSPTGPRIGLFGLFGSGNLGNDASFDVMYQFLREQHPGAVIDAMCTGPRRLHQQYGIDAIAIRWFQRYEGRVSGIPSLALKVLGKGVDALRTAAWVRRHDVVMVPGTGIFEASLPLRATGTPYALFLLSAAGWAWRTQVGYVSVGATTSKQRLIRLLFGGAGRLASYRSFRDETSRLALASEGVDTTEDGVYPDLVFGLPSPTRRASGRPVVGLGVMEYYGSADDRGHADVIHARYSEAMRKFTRWLVDEGYQVRLFGGDDIDSKMADEILSDLASQRPGLPPDTVTAGSLLSLGAVMSEMAAVEAVVAIRYHNVMAALKLSKPTIAISYCEKHDALMEDMGLPGFSQPAQAIDVDLLIEQFRELERRAPELRRVLDERNQVMAQDLDRQFARLSSMLVTSPGANARLASVGTADDG